MFHFVNENTFQPLLLKQYIHESLESCIQECNTEFSDLLILRLPKIANGVSIQKGALFGFAANVNESTGSLFNISETTSEQLADLDYLFEGI